jgi:hypothetical protein
MPGGNRPDRGSHFALLREEADFRQVLNHERGAERPHRWSVLDDECLR